jgi:hypothetical protein
MENATAGSHQYLFALRYPIKTMAFLEAQCCACTLHKFAGMPESYLEESAVNYSGQTQRLCRTGRGTQLLLSLSPSLYYRATKDSKS